MSFQDPYYSDAAVYSLNNQFGPDPNSLNPYGAYSSNFGPSLPPAFSNSISQTANEGGAGGGASLVSSPSYFTDIGYTPGETYAQYASDVYAADEAAGKAAGVWNPLGAGAGVSTNSLVSTPALSSFSPTSSMSAWDAAVAAMGGRGGGVGGTYPALGGSGGWPSPGQPLTLGDLLYGVYGQESSFGTNPVAMSYRPNAYGAFGPYQLTQAAVNSYSPGTNPYTYSGQYQAAGNMMNSLLSRYGGNANMALAGYNWGPNQNPVALNTPSMQPVETQNYVANAGATAVNSAYQRAVANSLVRANLSAQQFYPGGGSGGRY